MFGASFGAACSDTTDSRGINEALGRIVNSAIRTVVSFGRDCLPHRLACVRS